MKHSQVATDFHGVPDEILEKAAGYRAICIFVNKKIQASQVPLLVKNGNKIILCCSAGFDNVPIAECKSK